jgi:hypothetical protein
VQRTEIIFNARLLKNILVHPRINPPLVIVEVKVEKSWKECERMICWYRLHVHCAKTVFQGVFLSINKISTYGNSRGGTIGSCRSSSWFCMTARQVGLLLFGRLIVHLATYYLS